MDDALISVLFWGLVWLAVGLGAACFIGQCVRWSDIEDEVASCPVPDGVPEDWVVG